MKSYISAIKHGDNIIHSYILDGVIKREVVPFQPILGYIVPKKTEWTDIKGNYLETRRFDSMSECTEFKKSNQHMFDIFGDIGYTQAFLAETYPEDIQVQKEAMHIYSLDIECYSESGNFCKAENDNDFINAITFTNMVNRKSYVYHIKDYTPTSDHIKAFKCKDEEQLLEGIIHFFNSQDIHILTGWFIEGFDLPYICKRIEKVLGENESKRLSPVRKIYKGNKTLNKRQTEVYDIVGITTWDYMQLYTKYTYENRDSYTLDNIVKTELGESKLEYKSKYNSLNELYDKDPQHFYQYNVQDAELVLALDDKLKFIDIALTYSYQTKCPMEFIFGTVKPFDGLLYSRLYNRNILCDPNKNTPALDYGGGFVKDPVKGLSYFVSVYDVKSSYPHQLIQYNMGSDTLVPESFIKQHPELDSLRRTFYGVESFLDIDKLETVTETLKPYNINFTANGQFFYNNKVSFIAEITSEIFNKRVDTQKQMKQLKSTLDSCSDEEKIKVKLRIDQLDSLNMCYKILINSLYGFIGCNFSRWYDTRIAEAVTTMGQVTARGVATYVEQKNPMISWIYQDTDSAFFDMNEVINKRFGIDKPETSVILDFLLKYQDKVLEPCIKEYFDRLAKAVNVNCNKMIMEHECIADKSIFIEKKNYVMHLIHSDGYNILDKPKYKIKGLAVIKTAAYPAFTRKAMRKIIELIIETEDNKLVISEINKFKKEFYKALPDQITSPISVNMVGNVTDKATGKVTQVPHTLNTKGLPKQVRAAFVYNNAIKQLKLDKRYESIKDGNKIRYISIRQPNIFESPVIGCIEKLPPEILKHITIDYDEQWVKTFKKPVLAILDSIGYNFDRVMDLGSFFD